ncbi:histidine phosphatase family protein [Marinicella sp. W31]|uniref:histidine phosphatase family protein n=1 Tax=Marinicella sp. W31 TaxID=3023713 RepID=UPI003756FD51
MTAIYLIRHGQASFGAENYDQLSSLGETQAKRLGQALAQRIHTFDAVSLGSMQRHRQTAEICLHAMGQSLSADQWHQDTGWNEYDHQEILACQDDQWCTASDVKKYLQRQEDPKKAFANMFIQAMQRWMSGAYDSDYTETWLDYQKRVHSGLRNVKETLHKHQRVAVFTSGGPIALISQHLLGIAADQLMSLNWTLLNCGVTKLVLSKEGLFVASLNEHTAFEGMHKHLISYR